MFYKMMVLQLLTFFWVCHGMVLAFVGPGPFEPRGVLIKWHLPGSRQYYEGILWGLYIHTNRLVDLYNTLLLYNNYYYILLYRDYIWGFCILYYIYYIVNCILHNSIGCFAGLSKVGRLCRPERTLSGRVK